MATHKLRNSVETRLTVKNSFLRTHTHTHSGEVVSKKLCSFHCHLASHLLALKRHLSPLMEWPSGLTGKTEKDIQYIFHPVTMPLGGTQTVVVVWVVWGSVAFALWWRAELLTCLTSSLLVKALRRGNLKLQGRLFCWDGDCVTLSLRLLVFQTVIFVHCCSTWKKRRKKTQLQLGFILCVLLLSLDCLVDSPLGRILA